MIMQSSYDDPVPSRQEPGRLVKFLRIISGCFGGRLKLMGVVLGGLIFLTIVLQVLAPLPTRTVNDWGCPACQTDSEVSPSPSEAPTTSGLDIGVAQSIDPRALAAVPVIDLGPELQPRVISYATEDGDLRYVALNGGSWQAETVDAQGNVGDGQDLVVDKEDRPHISYRDQTNGGLKYAVKEEGAWQVTVVDSLGKPGQSVESSSIVVDSSDRPHIVYNIQSQDIPAYLKHAYYDGKVWQKEELGLEGHWPSLAIDNREDLHIVFHDDMEGLVYYARRTGDKWAAEVVDQQTPVEYDPRLVLDQDGQPQALYRGTDNQGTIKLASLKDQAWEVKVIDVSIGSGDMQDLAVKGGRMVVVYGHDDQGLAVAWRDSTLPGGWQRRSVVDHPAVCSVALDGEGYAHIAYTESVAGDLPEAETIQYLRLKVFKD